MRNKLLSIVVAGLLFFLVAGVWQLKYFTADEQSPGSEHDFRMYEQPFSQQYKVRHGVRRKLGLPRKVADANVAAGEINARGVIDESREPLDRHNFPLAPALLDRSGSSALRNPAIILFCYNRVDYLNQTLSSLAGLPGLQHMTVYLSQDGNNTEVSSLLDSAITGLFKGLTKHIEHWQHPRVPLISQNQPGHAWLSQHYKWGLDRVFWELKHSHAIILEDDMLFSQDFLTYMQSTAPLLEEDPTLWCISSWNDNGLSHLDWRNDRLFRTSYFPGLGWMLRRQLWDEIGPDFPAQAWDHWMRLEATSKGRECVAPEVNRNKNIGEKGANMQRQVFRKYLLKMSWSRDPVEDWGDLSYLLLENYDASLEGLIRGAQLWEGPMTHQLLAAGGANKTWLVPYKGERYIQIARAFKIWPFPRGHHHHTLVLHSGGSTFILADQRFSRLLPDSLQIHRSPLLRATAGQASQDCNSVCRERMLRCSQQDFWFINTCEDLQQHFPCERGCAVELGDDVPNYVTSPKLPTFQTCLVTQKEPKCSAKHPDTRRLCPCVGNAEDS